MQRRFRSKHPGRAAYRAVLDHAEERGIPVQLTFEEFCKEIAGTNYLTEKGSRREDLQLDRIDATLPYRAGNLRVVTCTVNAIKGNREKHSGNHWRTRPAPEPELDANGNPF